MLYDIYRAEDALSLYGVIGRNTPAINGIHFGQFFGTVQNICIRYAILCTAKLFDAPSSQYPTRSLRTAFKIADENLDALPVLQPIRLRRFLRSEGHGIEIEELSDVELARRLIEHFGPRMPTANTSLALAKLRAARDKHIAHSETGAPSSGPSIAEIESLLVFAKQFLSVFAGTFLSVIHDDGKGNYFVSDDAKRTAQSAKRLLKALGITPNDSPD